MLLLAEDEKGPNCDFGEARLCKAHAQAYKATRLLLESAPIAVVVTNTPSRWVGSACVCSTLTL